ncbi:type VI secretion system PAAR protein [Serratia silvae]|uniref:Type VI secretion system PAAR protein n=1 Tax=Serratia silvae TaxID=2824122 RepID=A0ABT0KHI1_9GAMM|nr:type VI secretion system PAAR protein [Serratia silvae]MCL1031488.1 type VI secretion system PAAR protein [Serratia silvae]
MTQAVKIGDIGTDHDGFPATVVISGSSTVKADNHGLARVGDALLPHSRPNHPLHPRKIASGSTTVFVDGKAAARSGDSIDCGGMVLGSGTVNIG